MKETQLLFSKSWFLIILALLVGFYAGVNINGLDSSYRFSLSGITGALTCFAMLFAGLKTGYHIRNSKK